MADEHDKNAFIDVNSEFTKTSAEPEWKAHYSHMGGYTDDLSSEGSISIAGRGYDDDALSFYEDDIAPIDSLKLTGNSVSLDLGDAFWAGFNPECAKSLQPMEYTTIPQDYDMDLDGILDVLVNDVPTHSTTTASSLSSSGPRLVDTGFHAYQKAKKGQVNKKIESFNERSLFVTNNNKTGILYFIVDKDQSTVPEKATVALWGYDRTNDFQDAKRASKKIIDSFDYNTAFLHKIVPIHSTDAIIGDTPNCAKDITDGTWIASMANKRDAQSLSPDIDDASAEILSESTIRLPADSGRYLIAVYPLMGYTGVKGGRSVHKRGYQRAVIGFGSTTNFKGPVYKVCSKEPSTATALPEPSPAVTSFTTGQRRSDIFDTTMINFDDMNPTTSSLDGPSNYFF